MAGVELATAYYSLVPSMDGTAAAIRSQSAGLASVWGGIGDDAGRGLKGGLLGSIGKLAVPIAGAFAALGLANIIGDSIRAGVGFALDGVNLAGDMSETRSAIEQTFGKDAAKSIDKWAGQGAGALGQTELAALRASQTFGVFGKAAGLTGGDLATFSTDLAGLGTDLSSFFNTSPEEAIEAIGAGLRGESEPLRKYGVLLDDATLKARAMSMGIYDGNGSLTQQQRMLAANAEIFAQTSDAQGDFERTSGSLANQQKILAANFENAKAKLGTSLLPAMTTFAQIANDQLVPVLNDIVDKVGPVLGDALAQSAPLFADLLVAIAPLIPELVKIGTEMLPPLIDGFIAISPLLIDMATNTASVFAAVNDLFALIAGDITIEEFMGRFGDLGGSIFDAGNKVKDFILGAISFFADLSREVGGKVGEVISFVKGIPGAISGAFAGAGSWLVGVGRDIFRGLINGLQSMVGSVISAVTGPIGDAIQGAKNLLGIKSPSRVFEEIGVNTALGFEKGIVKMQPQIQSVTAAMVAAPTAVAPAAGNGSVPPVVNNIKQYITDSDPRLWARQFGREFGRATSGRPA